MSLLVQKFGGTSVGSVERIQAVAKRIAASKSLGKDLVIVVSAMGHTTDEQTSLAKTISNNPPQREMDMLLATGEQVSIALLSIALHELGIHAISMTGSQVGIVTESSHGRARILEVRTERIKTLLEEGQVPPGADVGTYVFFLTVASDSNGEIFESNWIELDNPNSVIFADNDNAPAPTFDLLKPMSRESIIA